jgi:hypothetical protein
VHDHYKSLLAEPATLTPNTSRPASASAKFDKLTQPTPLHAHALKLVRETPPHHVVTTQLPPIGRKPSNSRRSGNHITGNFGLELGR